MPDSNPLKVFRLICAPILIASGIVVMILAVQSYRKAHPDPQPFTFSCDLLIGGAADVPQSTGVCFDRTDGHGKKIPFSDQDKQIVALAFYCGEKKGIPPHIPDTPAGYSRNLAPVTPSRHYVDVGKPEEKPSTTITLPADLNRVMQPGIDSLTRIVDKTLAINGVRRPAPQPRAAIAACEKDEEMSRASIPASEQ